MILKKYGLRVVILCDDPLTRQLLEYFLNRQHGGGAFTVTHTFLSIKEALQHDWGSTDILFVRHGRLNVSSTLRNAFLVQAYQENPALMLVTTNTDRNFHDFVREHFPEAFFISFSSANFNSIADNLLEMMLTAAQDNGIVAAKSSGQFNILLAVAQETQKLTIPYLFSEPAESPVRILAITDTTIETQRLLNLNPRVVDCLIMSRRLVINPSDSRLSWDGVRDLYTKANSLGIPIVILGELSAEQRAECPRAILFDDPYSPREFRERVLALANA